MDGVVNGVFYCNQKRTQELSDRMYSRNLSSAPVKMQYSIRSVPTRYVQMPILDCHKPVTVPCQQKPIYNTDTMFMPSNTLPFNGYQANVDVETKLHNTIFPLQACPQAKYIPGTNSDMFNSNYLTTATKPVYMTNQLLFNQQKFNPFNPNMCNTGHKLFNNHTRVQIRDL
jgi:hypothetical protein